MECAKAAGFKKGKKKQVKDDLDRIKQAEKKKRRLEKALATSAAIRSELEKKKLKKKEEQDRLDEESASIAEAVALQVLIGEDSDDSSDVMLKKNEGGLALWHYHDLSSYSYENVAGVCDAIRHGHLWNLGENSRSMTSSDHLFYPQCYYGEAGNLGAEAVTPLRIDDEERVNGLVFNRI